MKPKTRSSEDKRREAGWAAQGIVLTVVEYDKKLKAQDGKCAICRKPPKLKRLCVDHNHKTKKVRGLLCTYCNRRIVGRFQLDTAKALLEYLEKYDG